MPEKTFRECLGELVYDTAVTSATALYANLEPLPQSLTEVAKELREIGIALFPGHDFIQVEPNERLFEPRASQDNQTGSTDVPPVVSSAKL
jgi:hypothetical protein